MWRAPATAIAGDANAAWDFLRTYKQVLESSGDAIGSFRRTVTSHPPVTPRRQYTVFVAVSEPQGGRLLTVNGNGTNQIIEMRRHNETRYCTISSTYDKSGDSDVVHMELSMNKGVHDLITGERQEPSHNHVGTSIYFVEFEEKPPK